jgi:hypothetical protein
MFGLFPVELLRNLDEIPRHAVESEGRPNVSMDS